MISGPLSPLRNDRTTATRSTSPASRGASGSPATPDLTSQQQAQIAAQHQAFDYDSAERAELLREHDILEALLMMQLKNEDEITKKWIALI